MSNCSDRRQRGTALLEAMLGVFITTVIGAGTAQIASRIAAGQHELRVEGIALAQMRQMLVTHGSTLCGSTTRKVALPGNVLVSVEGVTCATQPPKLTVKPDLADPIGGKSLEVEAVKPVTVKVRLSGLKIKADAADTIEVGTRT